MHIRDYRLVITTGHKTFHFDLHKDVRKNFKHEIDSIIKHNELLSEQRIKNKD